MLSMFYSSQAVDNSKDIPVISPIIGVQGFAFIGSNILDIIALSMALFVGGLWLLHLIAYFYGSYHLHKSSEYDKLAPGVSIIKPLVGTDKNLKQNLESFFTLDYPKFEILLCLSSKDDLASTVVQELCYKYSNVDSSIFFDGENVGLNPKINNMMPGYKSAKYSLVLVSDAGIYMKSNALMDMVSCMKENVGLVTQIPYTKARETFTNKYETQFFGCAHARIYLVGNCLQFICASGMSSLMRKDVLDNCGGLQAFADVLAEDYFFGQALANSGYKACISHIPALQNAESVSLSTFNSRLCRWVKLRVAGLPQTLFLEPMQECFASGVVGMIAYWYLFALNPIYFIIFHLAWWFFWDYQLIRVIENGPIPFSFLEFSFMWLLRETLAFPLYLRALINPTIAWKTGNYRLDWGGKIRKQ